MHEWWLQDPKENVGSVMKGGYIYLAKCETDVVRAVLHFLGSMRNGVVERWGVCPLSGHESADFLLRMYKFAKSIK